jgi:hypothetical protein
VRSGRTGRSSASSPHSVTTPANAPSCGCPTSGRYWPAGWRDGPRGPTSAAARSPSARWCRCARCRTGSSVSSASTTASSPATRSSTATTHWPARRSPASATREARTVNCCSTR